jgi:hypothetical protein
MPGVAAVHPITKKRAQHLPRPQRFGGPATRPRLVTGRRLKRAAAPRVPTRFAFGVSGSYYRQMHWHNLGPVRRPPTAIRCSGMRAGCAFKASSPSAGIGPIAQAELLIGLKSETRLRRRDEVARRIGAFGIL